MGAPRSTTARAQEHDERGETTSEPSRRSIRVKTRCILLDGSLNGRECSELLTINAAVKKCL